MFITLGYEYDNRKELYLKYLEGKSNLTFKDLPLPKTRDEIYLYYLTGESNIKLSDILLEDTSILPKETLYLYYLAINGTMGVGNRIVIDALKVVDKLPTQYAPGQVFGVKIK